MAKKLLYYISKHTTYVEVFGGAGHLLFTKGPSPVEVFNDFDNNIYNFFKVLRDNPNELQRVLVLTPYSRKEFDVCKENLKFETDPIEKARIWYTLLMQSYDGVRKVWGYGKTYSVIDEWLKRIDIHMPSVVDRLRTIQLENKDFRDLIPRYDSKDTLFFLDPPYVLATKKVRHFDCEMSDKDHYDLINILRNIVGKVMFVTNENYIHSKLADFGWTKIDFGNMEVLWINYSLRFL